MLKIKLSEAFKNAVLSLIFYVIIAPEYHIELRERHTMVWDFHSLLLAIQMMFSFMLVDETATLKLCPNCYKAFFAETADDVYCSEECEMKDRQ